MPGDGSARPKVSAIVPVFSRERFIGAAVQSLLGQTMADFELLIVDDGSTDRTVEIASGFGDPRIRVIRHWLNQGIVAARNTGLEAARGHYIAWLDSDDIARPSRLEEQVRFLDDHPDTDFIGTCAGKLNPDGRRRPGVRVPPLRHEEIEAQLLFGTAFQQSSVMGRSEVLKRFPFRSEFPVSEDIDVYLRIVRKHRVANLPMVLVDRRIHPGQTVRTRQAELIEAQKKHLAGLLVEIGIEIGEGDLLRHIMLGSGRLLGATIDRPYLEWAEEWLKRLLAANRQSRRFDAESLSFISAKLWLRTCRSATKHAPATWVLGRALASPLSRPALGRRGRAELARTLRLNLMR